MAPLLSLPLSMQQQQQQLPSHVPRLPAMRKKEAFTFRLVRLSSEEHFSGSLMHSRLRCQSVSVASICGAILFLDLAEAITCRCWMGRSHRPEEWQSRSKTISVTKDAPVENIFFNMGHSRPLFSLFRLFY